MALPKGFRHLTCSSNESGDAARDLWDKWDPESPIKKAPRGLLSVSPPQIFNALLRRDPKRFAGKEEL